MKSPGKVFTMAADELTFGSEQTITTSSSGLYGGYYDSNDQRVVAIFTDYSSSSYGKAVALDVTQEGQLGRLLRVLLLHTTTQAQQIRHRASTRMQIKALFRLRTVVLF